MRTGLDNGFFIGEVRSNLNICGQGVGAVAHSTVDQDVGTPRSFRPYRMVIISVVVPEQDRHTTVMVAIPEFGGGEGIRDPCP